MTRHLSAGDILKIMLTLFSSAAIILLGSQAWDSWSLFRVNQRAEQAVSASQQIFAALVYQRTDRSTTQRLWDAEGSPTEQSKAYLADLRGHEMPALAAGIESLETLSFTGRDSLLPDLKRIGANLTALQNEFTAGISRPKAERRGALSPAYQSEGMALQNTLQQVAAALFATVKNGDPVIIQMMEVKQLAWLTRETAGEASLLISQGLAKGAVQPDAGLKHQGFMGGARILWVAIDDAVIGLDLPPAFQKTLSDAKATLFGADYVALQKRLLDALIGKQTPEMTADAWSPYTVPRLHVMLDVANAALAQAADRARLTRADAEAELIWRVVALVAAGAVTFAGFVLVSRRIIIPLGKLRGTTERLANGDLSPNKDFADRNDEIGALAKALDVFREHAIAKARIEGEQHQQQAKAEQRRVAVEDHILNFENHVSGALGELANASAQMDGTSESMLRIAERSATGVHSAEVASGEASNNVSGIAAATEELSASISEIGRQVAHSSAISQRAVRETQQTDQTVQGLAESATRIGAVVSLISGIAAQTNLLALNATIEAARAGDAGKGFAVVASEVKSLATQTAKATEEIAAQITHVRGVTEDAVNAIKQIRATIDEVNSVATNITVAVQQQGEAIQEIARNTQLAADRTRDASLGVKAVSEGTSETTRSAEAVKTAAGALGKQAARLREQVDGFMARIRAA